MNKEFDIEEIDSVVADIFKEYPLPMVFCFKGEMGAGKTTFISSMVKFIGSTEIVSSPTYTVVNEYAYAHGIIFHLDLFRLRNMEELLDLDLEPILYSNSYCFIEWPELAEQLIPKDYIVIELAKINEKGRKITSNIIRVGG